MLESPDIIMEISYNKLWKRMIDLNINKSELREMTQISTNSVAKMGKNESVSLEVLLRVCEVLECDIGDIVEVVNISDMNLITTKKKAGTFSINKIRPIHRWYEYVEGYSDCLVDNELEKLKDQNIKTIYDPFCGTGTTALVAASKGIVPYYSESNPFMQKVINAKINCVIDLKEKNGTVEIRNFLKSIKEHRIKGIKLRDTYGGFDKYYESVNLCELLEIKKKIMKLPEGSAKDILNIALCSIAVGVSKMIRRGDLRYRTENEVKEIGVKEEFVRKVEEIIFDIESYGDNIKTIANFLCEDARDNNVSNLFDCVITSPPYLNGTNYIRNTKLELKLSDCISEEKELSAFHEKGIIAGINNVSKRKKIIVLDLIRNYYERLQVEAYDSRIPLMVAGYFYDMKNVIEKLSISMKNNAFFIMDIGDSQFAGIHIPTHELLSAICLEYGFVKYDEEIIRQRKSKNGMMLSQRLLKFQLRKRENR